ncbi:MAG TPA: alkaline phosphatase family protein [Gemmatimonadaceae bacterium]|nr:alkaline phosphatase family protein [Gemmatimonadaceae bacterium]
MKRIPAVFSMIVAAVGVLSSATSSAATPPAKRALHGTPPDAPQPTLVVMVLVDQLRADLLDRYGDLFTGGFKRLRDQGHSYVNASHDHAITETAVGHATLSTGVYPSRHGVIANLWYENVREEWKQVFSVDDSTVSIVGSPGRPGASPAHLMRPGFAEWLAASNPRSQIASVSGKDRGAIHMGAHTKGYVYWFDSPSGRFVTSTYYRSADPEWVTRFNTGPLQAHRADTVWSLEVPPASVGRASRDTSAAEGDGIHSFFPHRFAEEGRPEAWWMWWEATPRLDEATLQLAATAVDALNLGRDADPDFLSVSLSATDRIGHGFGPLSREQLDNLLRLDRELGQFFDQLDAKVGKGKWTMMLTADHGVLDMPEDLVARGEYGHRLTPEDIAQLNAVRSAALADGGNPGAAKIVAGLKKLKIIGDAWTREDLMKKQPTDSFAVLQKRSLFNGRYESWFSRDGVEFRFIPGVVALPRGSSHGQMYWYDRHVPMIFMGPGIAPGKDQTRAGTVDFAPTFAAILGIRYPKDLDGKVLTAVVSR